MFFDNNIFFNFMYRLRDAGITIPVLPGIMPITAPGQIRRIKTLAEANLPADLLALMDRFHDRPEAMKQAGIVYASHQIIDLIANGVNAIHIYTMNKPDIVEGIAANLTQIIVG